MVNNDSISTGGSRVVVSPRVINELAKELVDGNVLLKDISAARVEIGKLIGEPIATPVSKSGQTGVMLSGKPRFDGVLGVVSGDFHFN